MGCSIYAFLPQPVCSLPGFCLRSVCLHLHSFVCLITPSWHWVFVEFGDCLNLVIHWCDYIIVYDPLVIGKMKKWINHLRELTGAAVTTPWFIIKRKKETFRSNKLREWIKANFNCETKSVAKQESCAMNWDRRFPSWLPSPVNIKSASLKQTRSIWSSIFA